MHPEFSLPAGRIFNGQKNLVWHHSGILSISQLLSNCYFIERREFPWYTRETEVLPVPSLSHDSFLRMIEKQKQCEKNSGIETQVKRHVA